MSDVLMIRQRFRAANFLDDANREGLGIKVAYSLPVLDITRWHDDIAAWRGYSNQLRLDNAPESLSSTMRTWAEKHQVALFFIQSGKPAQNAFIERFNRSYCETVLDSYLFDSLEHVQQLTDVWLVHYNEQRPHEALNFKTPLQQGKLQANFSTSQLG